MKNTKTERPVVLTTHTVRVPKRPEAAKKDTAKILTTRDVKVKK